MSPRKPLHWFAIALWLFAILYLLVMLPISWLIYRNVAEIGHQGLDIKIAWDTFEGGLLTCLELASAGFLIELLDAVRWQLTPPDERAHRGAKRKPRAG